MDKVEIIESQIKDNVKKDLKSNKNFTLQDMIIIFSILGGVIGTTVGIGSNELINSLTTNIIKPLITLLFENSIGFNFLQIKVKNVVFNIDKVLYQVFNFILVLLLIYLILRYVFYDLVMNAIMNKKYNSKIKEKQNTLIIKKLDDIHKGILYKY